MAFKAVFRDRFSLVTFALSQLLIDLQPLLFLTTGWGTLHGWTHTYVGAVVIGTITIVIAKPATTWVIAKWNAAFEGPIYLRDFNPGLSWSVCASSAYIGTFTHVLLDSIMHGDMAPFWPYAFRNEILGYINVYDLHLYCLIIGATSMVVYLGVRFRQSRRGSDGGSDSV